MVSSSGHFVISPQHISNGYDETSGRYACPDRGLLRGPRHSYSNNNNTNKNWNYSITKKESVKRRMKWNELSGEKLAEVP